MSSELTLMVLRIGFLLLLWLFVFAIVYALRSDLFGAPVRRLPNEAAGRQGDPSQSAQAPQSAQSAQSQAPVAVGAPAGAFQPGAPPPVTPTGGALPSAGPTGPSASDSVQPRILVITSGSAAGTTLPLDDDVITIGRSTDSTLAIVDEYTSTYHAKLSRTGNQWMLTDLDSTNGTKLNGSRVTGTVLVPAFTPVTIGTTTFELRP